MTTHPYKTQLQQNLQRHYDNKDWLIKSNFKDGKDEILLIIPLAEQIAPLFENLFSVLSLLPEIEHVPERTLISFCHLDGSGYCSKLINPNTQDQIHLALLGKLPERMLSPAQIDNL
ncbi:MAG TPA: hypothetical protein VKB19_03735 [Pedobacter sp.]|nr:hypothetical protein [Pedobacter sp.]